MPNSHHPILVQIFDLCRVIEQLGTSPETARAEKMAQEVFQSARELVSFKITHQARSAAIEAVLGEREYQDQKFGCVRQRGHEVGAWLSLMETHIRRASEAWADCSGDYVALAHVRKVVAIGLACGEQHGLPLRQQLPVASQPAQVV